jgi:hypothetical protein
MNLSPDQWATLRAELVARVEELAAALLPEGRKVRGVWVAGDVHGGPGDSFNLALSGPKAGQWYDHGSAPDAEKAGDLVRLVALRRGVTDAEAGALLWSDLGLDGSTSRPQPPPTKSAPRTKAPDDRVYATGVAVSDGGWEWLMVDRETGTKASRVEVYPWADGSIAFRVLRFDLPTPTDPKAKTYRPISPWIIDGRVQWRPGDPPGKLPLWMLPDLMEDRAAPVVVCEGEKAAAAAARLLPPEWCTTSPSHGAKSPHKSDWSPLDGRRVIVWPDFDKPGAEFARLVVGLVKHATILDVPALAKRIGWTLADKFDAADVPTELAAKVAAEFVRLAVPPAKPPTPPAGPPDDDDGESAQRARTYKRVVASIVHAIEQSGTLPNALNGWRRHSGGAADTGDDELQADFVHAWRMDGRPGERVIPDAWEKVVRDMRRARRAELVANLTGRPSTDAGRDALRSWVRAVAIGANPSGDKAAAGERVDFLTEVMRHWMWGVKRYALGLPVERELMPVLCGPQASGKTWAIEALGSVWEELSLPITAAALTDDRQAQVLYRGLVARWDELEGAHKADVDALKRSITSKTIAFRNLYSNAIQERLRTCSFIASTNLPVRHVIKDPTGARRYVEIETPTRCDWDTLRGLDARLLWDAVSESDVAPIKAVLDRLDAHQKHLVHQDAVCAWLIAETWDEITMRPADAPHLVKLPAYRSGRGYTMHELGQRHAYWARQLGQSPLLIQALGARLRQLGFPEPVKVKGTPDRPAGRYYAIPADVLDRSAPWMGGVELPAAVPVGTSGEAIVDADGLAETF